MDIFNKNKIEDLRKEVEALRIWNGTKDLRKEVEALRIWNGTNEEQIIELREEVKKLKYLDGALGCDLPEDSIITFLAKLTMAIKDYFGLEIEYQLEDDPRYEPLRPRKIRVLRVVKKRSGKKAK